MDIEHRLSLVMGEFARTLATDFSIKAILEQLVGRIVDVLPINGAGVTLIAPGSAPEYVAASDLEALFFEHLQATLGNGPCQSAFETGHAVSVPDLRVDDRFPAFAEKATIAGLVAVFAFPLRQGETRFGALDLYRTTPGALDPTAMTAAQTLADVAAAYLLVAQARLDLEASSEREQASSAHDERTVRALHSSEERKAAILASALDAVVTIDGQGRIVEFNPAAERTFGHSVAAANALDLADLVTPPEELGGRWVGVDRYLFDDDNPIGGRRVELVATRADGTTFPAEVSISAVQGIGPSFFTAFIRDLTRQRELAAERVRLESRVHQTERLESLGQLAGGVAHDFNNLLTVILNYAYFIAEAPRNDDATRRDASEIVAAAERAARLTHQLLMFARREPVHRSPMDLNLIIAELRDLLARALGDRIRLDLRPAPALPPFDGDRGQTEQVLMNLTFNARDAMADGGTLTIETSEHRDGRDRFVRLTVSDTGDGMDADVASHAFEPFFTTKSAGEGSGLGLATAYGIVTDAGGTVELTSTPGRGTTVLVQFPVTEAPMYEPPIRAPATMAPGHGETILVVEDQTAVRDVTVAMLRRNGYQVLQASGARAALALAAAEHFDLLLTDIVMPETSGRELARLLRARDPAHRELFMSGYNGASGTQASLEAGETLIQKPFREAALVAAVQAALTGTTSTPSESD